MKKLILLALVLVSAVAFAKPMMIRGGKSKKSQIYVTGNITGKNNLKKMRVNLAGLLDSSFASKQVSYLDIAVVIDKNYKSSAVMVAVSFVGDEAAYSLNFNSTGNIEYDKKTGAISFTATELSGSPIEVKGVLNIKGEEAVFDIQDPALPEPFTKNTPFMLEGYY